MLWGDIPLLVSHLHGSLVDVRAQRVIAFDALVEAIAQAEVIAVGEEHYHLDIQAFVLCLLKALVHRRPQHLALAMEFLDRDQQPAVDDYLSGIIDHHTFKTRTSANAAFMRLYFPLIHYARQQGLPVVAMNVPRHIARRVAHVGFQQAVQQLFTADRILLPETLAAVPPAYRAYFLATVTAYHPVQDEQKEYLVESAYLHDATMAASLAKFLEDHPGVTVLALAGRFHFDYGQAIPALLRQQRPTVAIRRITTLVVEDEEIVPLQRLARDELADYLRFFPPFPESLRHPEAGWSPCTGWAQRRITEEEHVRGAGYEARD